MDKFRKNGRKALSKKRLNIICIIPARGGSKGIHKKNLQSIDGKPLITWSIKQALHSKYIQEKVYVTSDCDEILKISFEHGAKTIKRPYSISDDFASSEDALLHALLLISEENEKIDFIVFLQATSPLRNINDIDNAIELIIEKNCDSLFSGNIYDGGFLWIKENDEYKSFNYDYKERLRRQDKVINYVENGSLYIFKPEILIQNKNRLGGKIGMYTMENWQSNEIDEPSDIDIVNFYMKKFISK